MEELLEGRREDALDVSFFSRLGFMRGEKRLMTH